MTNEAPVITEEQRQAWRIREHDRLYGGTYVPLPSLWRTSEWFNWQHAPDGTRWVPVEYSTPKLDHYAHVSLKASALVAFTENDAKGVADRQTVMKPGRYLTKYFGHILPAEQITELATAFCAEFAPMELQFAKTADDIEHVYLNGPSSCMSHDASDYSSSEHPVRVYAGPDLQVAYIARGDDDITARAVVWPERKLYSNLYGDSRRLTPLLMAAGYTRGPLSGARIQARQEDEQYVVPYVDGCSCGEHVGKFIVLGQGGISLHQTDGLSGPSVTCDCCGCGASETDLYYNADDGDNLCETCDSERRFFCDHLEETHAGARVFMHNGDTWCERAFEMHGFTCQRTDENYPNDEAVEVDGETWSQDAFERYGFVCAGTGGNYPIEELVALADGTQWCTDHFADYGMTVDGVNLRRDDAPADAVPYRCPETLPLPLPEPAAEPLVQAVA